MNYRNVGAAFLREDGTRVVRGQEFEPTEKELRMLRYKLRLVGEPREPMPAVERLGPSSLREEPREGEWPLRMDPKLYLALHPEGKHAGLARKVLGLSGSEAVQRQVDEEEDRGQDD